MKRLLIVCVTFSTIFGLKIFGNENQKWGHIKVREHANLFYWLYYTTAEVNRVSEKPLIIWLQGGPGASSSGFGNFAEIGPLDFDLNPRNTTWVKDVNVLFVDNPVGTGFSYVENKNAFAKTNRQIAEDFVVFLKAFYGENPEFSTTPLYIFSESYGGKMTVEIALLLHKTITQNDIQCNFKGIGLGSPWISPTDSVTSWAPYLLQIGAIDQIGFNRIQIMANKTKTAAETKNFIEATHKWGETERIIAEVTSGIDFYNVLTKVTHFLKDHSFEGIIFKPQSKLISEIDDKIQQLMLSNVSKDLNITNEWGLQSNDVFSELFEDFMKPATSVVEELLNKTDIKVAVFNGQLDLIVNTPGTIKWVDALHWTGSKKWKTAERRSFSVDGIYEGYVKKEGNLAFYWINRAGHMVPVDNPAAMDYIIKDITNDFEVLL